MLRNFLIVSSITLVALGIAAGCPERQSAADKTDKTSSTPTSQPSEESGETTKDKKKEELFVDWPKPETVLFITGRQEGYIEPCGCTGLANQKGGLARRHTLLKQLEAKGWPIVSLDLGNQVRRFGKQAEIKFQFTANALKTMDYKAIGIGRQDTLLSPLELFSHTATQGQDPAFLSANVAVLAPDFSKQFTVVESGGKKIGVTAIMGAEDVAKVKAGDIIVKSPEDGLKEVMPTLKAAKCDIYVLLASASIEESMKLGKEFPDFDIVVTIGAEGEPERVPRPIGDTKSVLVQSGKKGMYVGAIGIFNDDNKPIRYQRIPLDDRFDDSPDMLKLLAAYQQTLQNEGLAGLGIKPLPHPKGYSYVGSAACADCHEDEHDIWKDSPHAGATHSLTHPGERSEIPRHFDPECISCHVTGWNPQQYYPYRSGYLGLEESPKMLGSGCENCHGPGSAHVAVELGDLEVSKEERDKFRNDMRLTLEEAKKNKCIECHDLDNSPDFHVKGAFEEYWQRIEH